MLKSHAQAVLLALSLAAGSAVTSVPMKSPVPASVKQMQQHCKVLANDAEKLAADAEKAAEYHTLRP